MAKVENFLKLFLLLTLFQCVTNEQIKPEDEKLVQQQQQQLYKSSSNLTSIKIKELEAYNNWKIIDLSHNSIESIDTPNLLQKQKDLETLQLDFNAKFNERGNKNIFMHKSLKRMSCKGCGFEKIQAQHFAGFESLAELNLCANKIDSVDADAFKTNGYLKSLDLSENKLKMLQHSMFSVLKNFEQLNLASNPLKLVNKDKPFLTSKTLKRLFMENCLLTDIYISTFKELASLEELKLNLNQIVFIEPKSFNLNHRMTSLFLEGNRLKFLPVSVFEKKENLKELCVDNNPYVSSDEFFKFLSEYKRRELRTDNCNSDVQFFIEYLFPSNNDTSEIIETTEEPSEKSSKLKFHDGISDFFIGSYLTIILILQAIAFVLLTLYLIKITKYEKLGGGSDINYANTILNDNDIYKVYKFNE